MSTGVRGIRRLEIRCLLAENQLVRTGCTGWIVRTGTWSPPRDGATWTVSLQSFDMGSHALGTLRRLHRAVALSSVAAVLGEAVVPMDEVAVVRGGVGQCSAAAVDSCGCAGAGTVLRSWGTIVRSVCLPQPSYTQTLCCSVSVSSRIPPSEVSVSSTIPPSEWVALAHVVKGCRTTGVGVGAECCTCCPLRGGPSRVCIDGSVRDAESWSTASGTLWRSSCCSWGLYRSSWGEGAAWSEGSRGDTCALMMGAVDGQPRSPAGTWRTGSFQGAAEEGGLEWEGLVCGGGPSGASDGVRSVHIRGRGT